METINFENCIIKAEEVLGKVDLNWANNSTAMAGVGYAILALALALKDSPYSIKRS